MPTLMEDHTGLVWHFAAKLAEKWDKQVEEIVGDVWLGVHRASEKFDPEKGCWSSYAWSWAKACVRSALLKEQGRWGTGFRNESIFAEYDTAWLGAKDKIVERMIQKESLEEMRRALLWVKTSEKHLDCLGLWARGMSARSVGAHYGVSHREARSRIAVAQRRAQSYRKGRLDWIKAEMRKDNA